MIKINRPEKHENDQITQGIPIFAEIFKRLDRIEKQKECERDRVKLDEDSNLKSFSSSLWAP